MKTPIRVIFFDAAETLFHVNGSVADIYLTHAVQHGFRQTPDSQASITQAFQRAFRDAHTIWQLVMHLGANERMVLDRLGGKLDGGGGRIHGVLL